MFIQNYVFLQVLLNKTDEVCVQVNDTKHHCRRHSMEIFSQNYSLLFLHINFGTNTVLYVQYYVREIMRYE